MAAVLKLERAEVERICRETPGIVEIANLNAPGQTVVSGEAPAVASALERFRAGGARVVPLAVSAPFHCSLMKPAALQLARELAAATFRPLRCGLVCNVTAELLKSAEDAPELLERQVTAPVRWLESVRRLQALGARRYLEFGSGAVLTGLLNRILEQPDARAVVDMKSLEEAL